MGVLDDLVKQVASDTGGGASHAAMASAVLGMLNSQGSGGLPALVQSFQSQGLGDMVSKWISTGPNPPVSPDQVHAALGAEKVQQLAQQAGVSPDMAKTLLAAVLPILVDKLTPGGTMQSHQSLLGEGLGLLAKKFL
jgi:uncharacterized protein YidB (DUF937 family)